VIIPVYNRGPVIRYSLESVRRASAGLAVETIIVDDGSDPPTSGVIAQLGYDVSLVVRQPNQGLLYARIAGLDRATGKYVMFLDSDDLVSADKFRLQLEALASTGADLSYTDSAHCVLEGEYESLRPSPDMPTAETTDATEFGIRIQPPPHSPIFLASWLRRVVKDALIAPSPLFNSCAEIWFYQNGALHGGRAVRVAGPHAIVGSHPGARLTNHWEWIAVGSLAVMEAFARVEANTPAGNRARERMAEVVFVSWRALPYDFSREFDERLLNLWRRLGPGRMSALGGPSFRFLARFLGPVLAARIYRRLRGHGYSTCRTMTDGELGVLLDALPSP
jgi:glycosyltransferase involved in cell wall biosynthesis